MGASSDVVLAVIGLYIRRPLNASEIGAMAEIEMVDEL